MQEYMQAFRMIRAAHARWGVVRRGRSGWLKRICALGAALALTAGSARAAERPAGQPWLSLPLDSLGVPAIPTQFLSFGLSMLTVDFVDDSHLLVTFGTRGLIPRLPGDPPDDDDRMVAAELVELPSGNVLARTQWHMHDHGQYLWRLGHGRFLVRSRNTLFALTPLARLNTPNPLVPLIFPGREGRPVAALLSPDSSLVMVETVVPPAGTKLTQASLQAAVDPNTGALAAQTEKPQVLIDFYRISGGDAPGVPLTVAGAGVVRSPELIALPIDHDGYLWPGDPDRNRWPVSFNEYGGKEIPAAKVDSSCVPRLQMVSRFEFLAFACQGSDDRLKLQAFGMDGHETWEEGFGPTIGQPVFAFAPEAGRFAMSRIVSSIPDAGMMSMIPDGSTQEVRVYQTESGDLLLKTQSAPVERNAENFDLSADGLLAAVVNHGAVEVYKLRPPSSRDVKDLQTAASFAPPPFDGPVELRRLEGDAADNAGGSGGNAAAPASASAPPPARTPTRSAEAGEKVAAEAASSGPAQAKPKPTAVVSSSGDGNSADAAPRKPPTLLEPGERPEFQGGVSRQEQPQ